MDQGIDEGVGNLIPLDILVDRFLVIAIVTERVKHLCQCQMGKMGRNRLRGDTLSPQLDTCCGGQSLLGVKLGVKIDETAHQRVIRTVPVPNSWALAQLLFSPRA